jgi:hypothetical protein
MAEDTDASLGRARISRFLVKKRGLMSAIHITRRNRDGEVPQAASAGGLIELLLGVTARYYRGRRQRLQGNGRRQPGPALPG